jgi:hypothetical protein
LHPELLGLLEDPESTGIKEQEEDINDPDPRDRDASSEGQHAFIHRTKRVEDVS